MQEREEQYSSDMKKSTSSDLGARVFFSRTGKAFGTEPELKINIYLHLVQEILCHLPVKFQLAQ